MCAEPTTPRYVLHEDADGLRVSLVLRHVSKHEVRVLLADNAAAPWDVRTRQRRMEHTFADGDAHQEAQPQVTTVPTVTVSAPQVKRAFYVTRGLMEKYNT